MRSLLLSLLHSLLYSLARSLELSVIIFPSVRAPVRIFMAYNVFFVILIIASLLSFLTRSF